MKRRLADAGLIFLAVCAPLIAGLLTAGFVAAFYEVLRIRYER